MMKNLAPIILFTYNRPENTRLTLNALAFNNEAKNSVLHIYCDGFKENTTVGERQKIEEVRLIAKQEKRFKQVFISERASNLGLANSIIEGVTEIVNKYGKVIVLEDDILTSLFFLQYINEALTVYETEKKVISIGACNYFLPAKKATSSFFLPRIDSLGWATWQDRWQLFEQDGVLLLEKLKERGLTQSFSLYGFYDFTGILQNQIDGKNSSWAVRWQAVSYLNNMVTLYPTPSVSQHQLSDNGTHVKNLAIMPPLATQILVIEKLKIEVRLNDYYHFIKGMYFLSPQNIFKTPLKRLKLIVFWMINKKKIKQYLEVFSS
jgi:hypothetical protein